MFDDPDMQNWPSDRSFRCPTCQRTYGRHLDDCPQLLPPLTPEEPTMSTNDIAARREGLAASMRQLAAEAAALDAAEQLAAILPTEDRFPDGAVIRFRKQYGPAGKHYQYAAIRAAGKWYTTGAGSSLRNDGTTRGSSCYWEDLRALLTGESRGMPATNIEVATAWESLTEDLVKSLATESPSEQVDVPLTEGRMVEFFAMLTGQSVSEVRERMGMPSGD